MKKNPQHRHLGKVSVYRQVQCSGRYRQVQYRPSKVFIVIFIRSIFHSVLVFCRGKTKPRNRISQLFGYDQPYYITKKVRVRKKMNLKKVSFKEYLILQRYSLQALFNILKCYSNIYKRG